MSASAPAVNSVALVGNLTADPILKQLDDDRKVCQLRLAVNDQKDQPPMFIDIATFGAQADACAKYLTKGRAIAVTGRLVYREWDDNGTRRAATTSSDASNSAASPTKQPDEAPTAVTRRASDRLRALAATRPPVPGRSRRPDLRSARPVRRRETTKDPPEHERSPS